MGIFCDVSVARSPGGLQGVGRMALKTTWAAIILRLFRDTLSHFGGRVICWYEL